MFGFKGRNKMFTDTNHANMTTVTCSKYSAYETNIQNIKKIILRHTPEEKKMKREVDERSMESQGQSFAFTNCNSMQCTLHHDHVDRSFVRK